VVSEEGRVVINVVNLACLDFFGEQVVIVSPRQPLHDGKLATCNSFSGERGVYEVTMASGEVREFPPGNVRVFDRDLLQSLSQRSEPDLTPVLQEPFAKTDTADSEEAGEG
jgi:hypothetical protein